jgi:hypothetical protein
MTALQQIIKEAQSIRRKSPKMEWKKAVAQASAIYAKKHKGTSPVGKKKVVKKAAKKVAKKKAVGKYVKTVRKGKITDVIYTRKKIGTIKRKPTEKAVLKSIKNAVIVQKKHMIGEMFDVTVIKDLDALKKQYIKLSKKYHPDAGGTTIQFQQLQAEYDILMKKILRNGKLTSEQVDNEIELDQAVRDIVDTLVNIDGLNVELIGKWLWISGNTYPVKTTLKQAGLTFIKKDGKPYWVYKGVESTSRGKTSMEQIKSKYGVHVVDIPKIRKIGTIPKINKTKLKSAINKAKKALNKRPI